MAKLQKTDNLEGHFILFSKINLKNQKTKRQTQKIFLSSLLLFSFFFFFGFSSSSLHLFFFFFFFSLFLSFSLDAILTIIWPRVQIDKKVGGILSGSRLVVP
jgi:hypothetical protein